MNQINNNNKGKNPTGKENNERERNDSKASCDEGGGRERQAKETEEETIEPDPFSKSSMIRRSPVPAATRQTSHGTQRSESTENRSAFEKLGVQIRILKNMFAEQGRRSIHLPMRETVSAIAKLYDLAANESSRDTKGTSGSSRVAQSNKEVQTSPWLKVTDKSKRKKEDKTGVPEAKRRPGTVNETEAKKPQAAREVHQPPKETTNQEVGKQWIEVSYKRKAKKIRERKIAERPDAIIIKTKGELSYADILRKFKADSNLKEVGEAVAKIRRTQKGELLLQLKEKGEQTDKIKGAMIESLGDQAELRSTERKTTVVCKDMDEVTTKSDICDAIRTLLGEADLTEENVVSLRRAYGNTQTAIISMPTVDAEKLLMAGKVRIGWVNCRIRKQERPVQCFRCLEFDHLARNCKSKIDRSKMCRKCGTDGHNAKDCKEDPVCALCKSLSPDKAAHIAGSRECPVFIKALNKKYKR